jgi:hypothetical protein
MAICGFCLLLIEAPAGDGKQPVARSSDCLPFLAGVVSEPYFDNNYHQDMP